MWTGQQGIIFSGSASFSDICLLAFRPLEGTWCAAAVIPTFTNMSSHKYTATGDPRSISYVIDLNGAYIYTL